MNLVPIGRFSKMTGLSVKALRNYAAQGLLRAAYVDPVTGYRFYTSGQVNRAEAIRLLRSVEISLGEIRQLLDIEDPEILHERLLVYRKRVADRLAAHERALVYLELLIRRKRGTMPYNVEVEEVPPQLVAALKLRTTLVRIAGDVGSELRSLVLAIGVEGASPVGAPLIVYLEPFGELTEGEIEICMPVDGQFDGGSGTFGRQLDGGTMATAVHHGPYQEIAPAYHTLSGWIADNGRSLVGPPREIYLNDPQSVSPSELLTRIEFPINSMPS